MLTCCGKIIDDHRDLAAALAIVVIGLAIFLPAVRYQFTYFDDRVLIVNDAAFIRDWRNLPTVLVSDVFRAGTVAYRPGLVISFMVDAAWAGIRPWAFHLTNILIHIAAAILLMVLLRMMGSGRGLALALAAVFLVHPLQAQAVAWIPGRNDSLLGLFALLSLAAYLRHLRGGGAWWLALHFAAFTAALLVKEAGIALPVVYSVLYLYGRGKDARFWTWLAHAAAWAAIGLAWFILRNNAVNATPDVYPMVFNTARENVLGLAGYIGKVVLPVRLSVLPVPSAPNLVHGLVGLAVLVLFLAAGVKSRLLALTGGLVVLLFLAPHLMRGTTYPNFLEHRMYVPLAGICLLLGQAQVWDRLGRHRLISVALVAALAAMFALRTSQRLPVFASSFTLLNDAIEASPDISLPYSYLGSLYIDRDEYDIAEVYIDKAVRLDPLNKDHYQNLGIIYQYTNRFAAAEMAFARGIAIAPRSSGLRYSLGFLYQQNGRLDRAAEEYRKAVLARPGNVMALVNLGMIYQLRNVPDTAAFFYRRALGYDPLCPPALNNLGVLFARSGSPDSARWYLMRSRQAAASAAGAVER